jgi:ABC-type Zn uptake system ZnuABC Zn-binding protein ZnuA
MFGVHWRPVALLAALSALLAMVALGCGSDGQSNGEVSVVATTTHAADLVRAVVGERAEVHGLLSPSSDPHDYEPRPSDAREVAEADLVVRSGGDVDDWLSDLIDNAGGQADTLALIDEVRAMERDGERDPHWWQDPRNAILAVGAIRDRLTSS